MRDSERKHLQAGEKIFLAPEGLEGAQDEFEVVSVVGEGATAVCYKVNRIRNGQSKRGTLKEFYPIEGAAETSNGSYRMARDKRSCQLFAEGDELKVFHERREKYLESYQVVWDITQEHDREYIGNFLQSGDVYYGTGDRNLASVYLWTTEDSGISMEAYLEEIRETPGKNAESKLNDILRIVATLTDRIQELHQIGYAHLDIKPSNILLPYQGKNEINPENIVLCDIDSLYHCGSHVDYRMVGSEGYRAPELEAGIRPDFRADIYSIGAVLFRAIVINDDLGKDGCYRADYYNNIDVLVKNSRLIAGSLVNSDDQLVAELADLIKTCLEPGREDRYPGCGELLGALNGVLEKTHLTAEKRAQAEKYELADVAVAVQKLLYEHPLYEALPSSSKKEKDIEIRVLVVGAGMFGQKFMDLCLQAGQMRGHALSITALSDKPEIDRDNYCRFRPDIARFVDIDTPMRKGSFVQNTAGASKNPKGLPYGTIHFERIRGEEGTAKFQDADGNGIAPENRKLVSHLIRLAEEQEKGYHYLFVALGEDELNRQVAQAFAEEIAGLRGKNSCTVGFVWEREERPPATDGEDALCPVWIRRRLTVDAIDGDLEQMAFNTDLVWNGGSYEDPEAQRRDFCADSYRYSSSLAYVLSLKYKLYSLGISLEGDRTQAARKFSDLILARIGTEAQTRKNYDLLAWLEHRRWVLDRAAEGWQAPRDGEGNLDLEGCVKKGMVKNPKENTHPCMVPSTPRPALMEEEYKVGDRAKWENPDVDPDLDSLDEMSVRLHQCFRRKADEIISENPLYTGYMEKIQNMIINLGEEVNREFARFRFCLSNILSGVDSYVRRYGSEKKQFLSSLNDIPEGDRKLITDLLQEVDKEFFPVIEANLYRDYKKNDVDLVRKIPYILTFRPVSGIAMAFEDGLSQNGRNEAVFADVASATVLCPQKISYLYLFTGSKSGELLADKVSGVLSYLNRRQMSCGVSLWIVCTAEVGAEAKHDLRNRLEELKKKVEWEETNAVLADYRIDDCPNQQMAAQHFIHVLESLPNIVYDSSVPLFSSVPESENFVQEVLGSGIPCFTFDWRKKSFTNTEGCDYLRYVEDNSYLSLSDLFALGNIVGYCRRPPEFMEDYQNLWKIYTTNAGGKGENLFSDSVMTWNALCECLSDYEKNRKPLAEMEVDPEENSDEKDLIYELPRYTAGTVSRLLDHLIEEGLVARDSSLDSHTSESNRLTLKADGAWEKCFDRVFAKPWYLQEYYDVQVHVSGGREKKVRFLYNSMEVEGVNLNQHNRKNRVNYLYRLLENLQEQQFIRNLKRDEAENGVVRFSYSSPMIKDLLTSDGRILEIYAYYEALKTGYFDEIVAGYEFLRKGSSGREGTDLVLTKGFHTLFVSCKAGKDPVCVCDSERDVLVEDLGIGAIVLALEIASAQEGKDGEEIAQRRIISQKELLEDIGQTLKSRMSEQM